MCRSASILVALVFSSFGSLLLAEDKTPAAPPKLAKGVYAVLRESLREKEVLPLKDGETLLVHRARYLKKDDKEPPRYVVVRSTPDVALDLVGAPKAVKEGDEVVRILLKLAPRAATALEDLTSKRVGGQVAIVIGGEVVTMHKIRGVIRGGDVQISSCTPGAAGYLLEQLAFTPEKK